VHGISTRPMRIGSKRLDTQRERAIPSRIRSPVRVAGIGDRILPNGGLISEEVQPQTGILPGDDGLTVTGHGAGSQLTVCGERSASGQCVPNSVTLQ